MAHSNKIKYAILFITCIPIIMHIKMVYHYALNIPREDDYDAVLSVFCNFKKAAGFDKLALIFQQQCEHRAVFTKLIFLSHYFVFGNINFRHIILFDILLLLGIFVTLVYFIKQVLPGNWHIPAMVLSFGLFDLNNFENSDFASAGLFNYSIILLFLLSILFYSFKNNKYIIPAILLQVMLIYSGGNGMIGALFITLFTILNREPKRYIGSTIAFLVFAPLYFYHYDFANPNSIYFTLDTTQFIPYFITALGANFGPHFAQPGGTALLIMLLAYIPLFKNGGINRQTTALLCITAFVITSLGIMAIFRGKLPIENAFSNRYLIYSHILIAMAFVFLFMKMKNNILFAGAAAFAITLYCFSYKGGKAGFDAFYATMKTSEYSYPIQAKDHAKQIAEEACRLDIYCIEKHRAD